ncbi:UDP-N-acetylmuramoyl-L-alanyl-D-glutamate--2,6-diaminopimelate ligase [Uliginosibacterium sp. H1]|uniref:UDP-N-acetylmuramoyl-L-alanyl-D-glutamate--2, 6-diaminopimelate ligase n=1 Tax=Uliginosibacterium sp. H1 TaxID=3114757 RepID=UPI002E19E335|nr:UDP-N-acetylmuramoyl-L-alanyl-D-glutamate--2,6-diaminopimelate ligase [Uliginosibacterium sp. H1]
MQSPSLASAMLNLLHAEGIVPKRVCADSRMVKPGDVFLAYPGHAVDGRRFIADAVERGAVAVLWERDGYEWDAGLNVPNVPVDQLRWLAGEIADEVFGRPSEQMVTVGVTGTNGKTSVTQWLARAFGVLGKKCAVIGTLGMGFPGRLNPSSNTTPDAILLQEQLARFRAEGAQAVAMEVSSIGLDQGRINGCRINIAVLTNLTRDHLDYHQTMERYAAAKSKLFDRPELKAVVLNLDDLMGVSLARRLQGRGIEVVGYTLIPDNALAAPSSRVLVAEHLRTTATGLRFTVVCEDQRADVSVALVGQFNVSNLLAVVAVLMQAGYTLQQAVDTAGDLTPPEGRMQTVGGVGEPLVVVDYAHTPDALEQALLALRHTAMSRNGSLVCVFGCGGDRDPGKRPLMGDVAARLSQRVVVTSDNPRSEDPRAIMDAVLKGAPEALAIEDRSEAIRSTIGGADANDVILIAGKGHENYQEVRGERTHFSDVEQARAALAAWNRAQELRS